MADCGGGSSRQAEVGDGTKSGDVPGRLCLSGDDEPASVTVPRGLGSSTQERRKKLVLHVDLNNTILVSDAVMREGTVSALDYFLSTVTWGKINKQGELTVTDRGSVSRRNGRHLFVCVSGQVTTVRLTVKVLFTASPVEKPFNPTQPLLNI